MKKRLLLLSFACFLFAGSQMSFAQSKVKQERKAVSRTNSNVNQRALNVINSLERTHQLEDSQKNKIVEIYAAVEDKMNGADAIHEVSERQESRAKLQTLINKKIKTVLTTDQYETYLKIMSAK